MTKITALGSAELSRAAIGEFQLCRRAPVVVAEALECLGGNGYVEGAGVLGTLRAKLADTVVFEASLPL